MACLQAKSRPVSTLWLKRLSRDQSGSSAPAGCVFALTGFLLNFTIREHPPSSKSAIARSLSGPQAHLAPNQHRLTDDGEAGKLPPSAVLEHQGSKQHLPKGGQDHVHADSVLHGSEAERHGNGQGEEERTIDQRRPLLQGALAQIKVSHMLSQINPM